MDAVPTGSSVRVINLQTAKAMGLALPQSLVARTDRVIQ